MKSGISFFIGFVDAGDNLIESLITTAGEEVTLTATLDAGTNTIFIASSSFSDAACAGYTVTLTQP